MIGEQNKKHQKDKLRREHIIQSLIILVNQTDDDTGKFLLSHMESMLFQSVFLFSRLSLNY